MMDSAARHQWRIFHGAQPHPSNQLIVDPSKFPIKPQDLMDSKGSMASIFGNIETECSVSWLRRFAVDILAPAGLGFCPFTYQDIQDVYRRKYDESFHFNDLVGPWHSRRGGGFLVVPFGQISWQEDINPNTMFFWTSDLVVRLYDGYGKAPKDEEHIQQAIQGGFDAGCSPIPASWLPWEGNRGAVSEDPAIIDRIKGMYPDVQEPVMV